MREKKEATHVGLTPQPILFFFFLPEATSEHTVCQSMIKTIKSKLISSVLIKLFFGG